MCRDHGCHNFSPPRVPFSSLCLSRRVAHSGDNYNVHRLYVCISPLLKQIGFLPLADWSFYYYLDVQSCPKLWHERFLKMSLSAKDYRTRSPICPEFWAALYEFISAFCSEQPWTIPQSPRLVVAHVVTEMKIP